MWLAALSFKHQPEEAKTCAPENDQPADAPCRLTPRSARALHGLSGAELGTCSPPAMLAWHEVSSSMRPGKQCVNETEAPWSQALPRGHLHAGLATDSFPPSGPEGRSSKCLLLSTAKAWVPSGL